MRGFSRYLHVVRHALAGYALSTLDSRDFAVVTGEVDM
jgi:hypothetical protein